jgi:hypothetical protein
MRRLYQDVDLDPAGATRGTWRRGTWLTCVKVVTGCGPTGATTGTSGYFGGSTSRNPYWGSKNKKRTKNVTIVKICLLHEVTVETENL